MAQSWSVLDGHGVFEVGIINDSKSSKKLLIKNAGLTPIFIDRFSSSCGCVTVNHDSLIVEPNSDSTLSLLLSPRVPGVFEQNIYCHIDSAKIVRQLHVTGVSAGIWATDSHLNLGSITLDQRKNSVASSVVFFAPTDLANPKEHKMEIKNSDKRLQAKLVKLDSPLQLEQYREHISAWQFNVEWDERSKWSGSGTVQFELIGHDGSKKHIQVRFERPILTVVPKVLNFGKVQGASAELSCIIDLLSPDLSLNDVVISTSSSRIAVTKRVSGKQIAMDIEIKRDSLEPIFFKGSIDIALGSEQAINVPVVAVFSQ